MLVGVWVARYLGPEQFGLFNYATAFVALFSSIATLGLNRIVVLDLIKDPGAANATLGTAFLLQIMGGLLAFSLAVFAISFARPDNSLVKLMVAVLSLTMLFKATEVVIYWFESQVQSKYTVWIQNGAFLIFCVVKIALIIIKASVMAFVWAILIEGLFVAVGLLGMYAWRGGSFVAWRGNYRRSRALLKDSWPLILSGIAIMVYMRVDQIMLGQMLGDEAVGLYSAAVRISEVWYFIPPAIMASVFPLIIEAKKKSEALYYLHLQKIYDIMVLLALAVAIPMTFLSDWVITLFYGASYLKSGAVLAIHIWTSVFVFLGITSGSWYLAENLQIYSFYRTVLGGVVNVAVNLLLIPRHGVLGAAVGTLIAQIVAAYLFDLIDVKTRITFWMKTKSLLLFHHALYRDIK